MLGYGGILCPNFSTLTFRCHKTMRLSRYTLFIPDFPEAGKHLAFNTRTQAQVVIDAELKRALEALPAAPGEGPAREALLALERMGIVAVEAADEGRVLEDWFQALKQDRSELSATVLTTYDCNFACPYCVEEGAKSRVYMDAGTARRAAAYIQARAERDGPQRLRVNFYGGEPLLNRRAIGIVARALQAFCARKTLPFSFSLTTNGALLTPDTVEALTAWGLQSAKITLDGTREFHDRKRPFRDGRGSFDLLLRHLHYAAGRIQVDIGCNFDQENLASLYDLLALLEAEGLKEKIRSISFKPILATYPERQRSHGGADLGCVFSEPAVMRSMVGLKRAALERGFPTSIGLGVNLCSMAMGDTVLIIDPRGRLFRCPAFVGREGFSAGDIDHPGQEDFRPLELWRRCQDCPYVPLCGDGCLYAAYIRFGDLTRLNCQKDFMEYMVREHVKMNYTYGRRRG